MYTEKTSLNNLPERLYIHHHISDGELNPLMGSEMQSDFINFVQNKSMYRAEDSMIISNMDHISYLYLDPLSSDNTSTTEYYDVIKLREAEYGQLHAIYSPLIISTDYIKNEYPDIYELLIKGNKVVICWSLAHQDCYCKEHGYISDFLESRLNKDLRLNFSMMRLLLNKMEFMSHTDVNGYFPHVLRNPVEICFWLDVLDTEDSVDYVRGVKRWASQYFNISPEDIADTVKPIFEYTNFYYKVKGKLSSLGCFKHFLGDMLAAGETEITECFIKNYTGIVISNDECERIAETLARRIHEGLQSGQISDEHYR